MAATWALEPLCDSLTNQSIEDQFDYGHEHSENLDDYDSEDPLHQDTLIYENHNVVDAAVDEESFEDAQQWRVGVKESSDQRIEERHLYVSEEWLISPGTKEISRANFNIRFQNDKSKFINCIKEVKLDSCLWIRFFGAL